MYLISAYFDDSSNQKIQNLIEKVAKKSGNPFMIDNQVPPHMTISSIESRSVEELLPAFESLQGKVGSGEIQIVSLGALLPYVLYVTPVLNAYLFEMQKQIYDTFLPIEDTKISKYYQPGSWLPHITIGKTLTKEQLQTGFLCLQENFVPFTATITHLGLAKTNPHKDVSRMVLEIGE